MVRRLRSWSARPIAIPSELAASNLVFAEKSFSITHPIQLMTRVDRVYDDGSALALLELKTRRSNRIFESDIIELSAQRLALRYNTGQQVHEYGYVVLLNAESRRQSVHKVALYSEKRLIEIARRRRLLLDGAIAPTGPGKGTYCKHCEYQAECRSMHCTR